MELIEMLPYGYKTYTGVILPNNVIDNLNYQYGRCNLYIKEGKKIPETLLNGIHNLFVTASSK